MPSIKKFEPISTKGMPRRINKRAPIFKKSKKLKVLPKAWTPGDAGPYGDYVDIEIVLNCNRVICSATVDDLRRLLVYARDNRLVDFHTIISWDDVSRTCPGKMSVKAIIENLRQIEP